MAEADRAQAASRLAGYALLIERYGLNAIPNWHKSIVSASGTHRITSIGSVIEETYPSRYWPGDTPGDHLEFALKYDGTNLAILDRLLRKMAAREIIAYVESKPTGKYARRLWFLYEFLTGNRLPLENLKQGNYVDLIDPGEYYTVIPSRRVRRQRINNNLPGDRRFCPLVRRTEVLRGFETADLREKCRKVISGYSPELLKRALGYLYTRETKSSFQIEQIQLTSSRTERFVALLQLAEREDYCRKTKLIELQNSIVDARFRDSDYRSSQNYVGETVAWRKERIHFVCPRPDDLAGLMEGLVTAHDLMGTGRVPAVVHAAAIAYGFVFLHPFEDGNGRIHRFLIHNILARRGFTPEGVMFPVSATMLKNPGDYEFSLEAYSTRLMPLVDYSLDEDGRMTVDSDTGVWYRYIDMTPQVEALYRFIDQTISTELLGELEFLASYDRAKKSIQERVDMPDRRIDQFIRFCLQNNGQLSRQKRRSHFGFLAEAEISSLEQAVRSAYGSAVSEHENEP